MNRHRLFRILERDIFKFEKPVLNVFEVYFEIVMQALKVDFIAWSEDTMLD